MSKDNDYKICIDCKKKLKLSNFYNSNDPLSDGKAPICKPCIKKIINYDDIKTIYSVLRSMNMPFIYNLWDDQNKKGGNIFGLYVRLINSLPNYKGLTWEDSTFCDSEDQAEHGSKNMNSSTDEEHSNLINKWGEGYSSEEYRAFERKYGMLKNNYQEKTAMHTEALLTYIRYRVKEELATAKGDSKSAKDWGALAKDAATAAKINPSQLSQSDLSDGLDNFGQLVRSVEQAVDIIPILPQFKERPNDKVDFTIWCYVNYIRDLKGLPLASYEEIYSFYEARKKEYEQSSVDET